RQDGLVNLTAFDLGDTGNVTITGDTVNLGGRITVIGEGLSAGNAGDITVTGKSVTIQPRLSGVSDGGLFIVARGSGNAGNVTLTGETGTVNAAVFTRTEGRGTGEVGDITVTGQKTVTVGKSGSLESTDISASQANRTSGNITVTGETVTVEGRVTT